MSFFQSFSFLFFIFYITILRTFDKNNIYNIQMSNKTKRIQQTRQKYTRSRKIKPLGKLQNYTDDVVLIGSSIISRWKLHSLFGLKNIKNNGISGLFTKNLFKTQFDFSNPKYIVFYCGGNDLRNNIFPSIIINNINKFLTSLMTQFPHTKIILLSILMSENFVNLKKINKNINIVNNWYSDFSKKNFNHFIYINLKLDKHEFYNTDDIHLNNNGYDELKNSIETELLLN